MTKVIIAILNYNGVGFLEKFLPAFLQNSNDHQIVIIDNASTDDSLSWLKTNYPMIQTIGLQENLGFTGGYNEGLTGVKSDYFLIVNSDIEVTPNWVEPLKEFLDNNPEYSACQPKILSQTQKHLFEYAGAAGGFVDLFGYPYCRGRIFETIEEDL